MSLNELNDSIETSTKDVLLSPHEVNFCDAEKSELNMTAEYKAD